MKLPLLKLISIMFLLSLWGCASSPKPVEQNNSNTMIALPIATAVQVDSQDEVKLLRLTQLINEHKGDNKEKSLLLFERAVIYDRLGLSAHSQYYFSLSVNANPSFAPAYSSLGIYYVLGESYDEAFDAFDSAIELSEEPNDIYLHRAVGLAQVKRYPLASRDINQYYNVDPNDPYRVLWRYIIDSNIDKQEALAELTKHQVDKEDSNHVWGLIDVIAGRMTERSYFEKVGKGVSSNKQVAQRLCEAYFYLAHWHKLAGDLDKAIYYFKLTTTTNIHEFIEYKYALMELATIQKEFAKNVK